MGLRALGINPVEAAIRALDDPDERRRRRIAQRRRAMYENNVAATFQADLTAIVNDTRRRALIGAFAAMSSAINLFRRMVREVAGPAYAPPPTRTVKGGEDAMRGAEREARLNAKMGTAAHICAAAGSSFVYDYYVERLGIVRSAMWPGQVTVISDPDDPTREIAVIYDRVVTGPDGNKVCYHVYWDDEEAFQLDEQNHRRPLRDKDGKYALAIDKSNGHPGILPIVGIHAEERTDSYWPSNPSGDLDAGQSAIQFALGMALRVIKTQGHTQLGVDGNLETFPKNQVLDSENPFISGQGNTSKVLHNPTDPSNFLKVIETVSLAVAANHGVNRDRLNQTSGANPADMAGLLERRRGTIEIFTEAELRTFEVLKVVSQQHKDPTRRFRPDAELKPDFAEISHKVDRDKLLDIWEHEIEMGLRSLWDCVREDNPEITTDEDAKTFVERNFESWVWLVDMKTRRGISSNNNVMQPGNTPEENGENGVAVREGELDRDDAAAEAKQGRAPYQAGMPTPRRRRRGA